MSTVMDILKKKQRVLKSGGGSSGKSPASSRVPVKFLPASQITGATKQKRNISMGPGSVKLPQDTQKHNKNVLPPEKPKSLHVSNRGKSRLQTILLTTISWCLLFSQGLQWWNTEVPSNTKVTEIKENGYSLTFCYRQFPGLFMPVMLSGWADGRGGLILKLIGFAIFSNCMFCRCFFGEGFFYFMRFVYPCVLQYVQIFKRLKLKNWFALSILFVVMQFHWIIWGCIHSQNLFKSFEYNDYRT